MRHAIWIAVAAAIATGPAGAATVSGFDPAGFAAAQRAGEPILVDISAPWCPTCARQRPILSQLESEPAYARLHVFAVDFDHQKDVVRALHATMQSTLIVFRGSAEQGRSTGDTDPASIAALLARANG